MEINTIPWGHYSLKYLNVNIESNNWTLWKTKIPLKAVSQNERPAQQNNYDSDDESIFSEVTYTTTFDMNNAFSGDVTVRCQGKPIDVKFAQVEQFPLNNSYHQIIDFNTSLKHCAGAWMIAISESHNEFKAFEYRASTVETRA